MVRRGDSLPHALPPSHPHGPTRSREIAERLQLIQNAAGAILSPFNSGLGMRGIKTLPGGLCLTLSVKAGMGGSYIDHSYLGCPIHAVSSHEWGIARQTPPCSVTLAVSSDRLPETTDISPVNCPALRTARTFSSSPVLLIETVPPRTTKRGSSGHEVHREPLHCVRNAIALLI